MLNASFLFKTAITAEAKLRIVEFSTGAELSHSGFFLECFENNYFRKTIKIKVAFIG